MHADPVVSVRAPRVRSSRRHLSPLRYPGGKARLASYLGDLFLHQHGLLEVEVWVEPFAGGAGAGLTLLDAGLVSEVWLVEKNPALAAFWRTVLHAGDVLAERVEQTAATMAVWEQSKAVLACHGAGGVVDDVDVAFATFFINRCSRSGMYTPSVGPMGGKSQAGRWTVGSRYNAPALADRIRHVQSLASSIRLIEGDAVDYIAELDGSVGIEDEVFLFVDPPYLVDGRRLYEHSFDAADHRRLARALTACHARWVLTYDADRAVSHTLYPNHRILSFEIGHTAHLQHVDREFAVFSDDVSVDPEMLPFTTGAAHWVRWPGTPAHQLQLPF